MIDDITPDGALRRANPSELGMTTVLHGKLERLEELHAIDIR